MEFGFDTLLVQNPNAVQVPNRQSNRLRVTRCNHHRRSKITMDVSEVRMVTESGFWLSVFSLAEVRIEVTELHPVTHSPFFHFPPFNKIGPGKTHREKKIVSKNEE